MAPQPPGSSRSDTEGVELKEYAAGNPTVLGLNAGPTIYCLCDSEQICEPCSDFIYSSTKRGYQTELKGSDEVMSVCALCPQSGTHTQALSPSPFRSFSPTQRSYCTPFFFHFTAHGFHFHFLSPKSYQLIFPSMTAKHGSGWCLGHGTVSQSESWKETLHDLLCVVPRQ